jgi:hypothetical protein
MVSGPDFGKHCSYVKIDWSRIPREITATLNRLVVIDLSKSGETHSFFYFSGLTRSSIVSSRQTSTATEGESF